MTKVGFIGLGRMGMPMAGKILGRGFELHLYNRTRSRAESLASQGARIAESVADLTGRVDILLACLSDIPASEEVFLGENGVMRAARPGQILADLSTVDPATSLRLYQRAREKGAYFLDAPVSGGPQGAESGSLVVMVGGDEEAFVQALPTFQALGPTVVHMGGPGTGTATKLVNQILVGVHTLVSCEAMLLAADSGVDPGKLTQVLMSAWGASRMFERNAPMISRCEFGPSAVPIRNLVKDLGIILKLAEERGLSFPATRQAEWMNRRAEEQGMASDDITSIYRLLEQGTESP